MSPSSRDWRLYADDIIEACRKIQRFTEGMSYEASHISWQPLTAA